MWRPAGAWAAAVADDRGCIAAGAGAGRLTTARIEDGGAVGAESAGYALAIVGSGGAAFSAAIAASEQGRRVVMIERGTVGGTCVNVGCIPSKALLAAGEARARAGEQRFPGIRTAAGPVDFAALIAGKDEIVGALRQEKYLDLAAEYGIELVCGEARFVPGPALVVGARRIEAAHYLIATGAEPHIPDIPGLDEGGFLTSTTAMALDHLPESLLVIGGGYVALEQAQLFAHLGARVTLLVRSTIARGEEPEIAQALRDALIADGITIIEGAAVQRVRRDERQVVASAEGREHRAERLLVATGRRPRTAGLGLEAIGVGVGERGEVRVGADLSTANARVWAAGDVTGHPQFVYVAAQHGRAVVGNAFDGARSRVEYGSLPRIIFTNPTVASAGLTEAQARGQGVDVESRVFELAGVSRAIVSRRPRGLVKLVAERDTGRILGVHLLAEGAGDAILAGVYAIAAGMTVEQMAGSWNPYLTIGEAIHLAAQSFTRDPARLSCCA
jgi:mercuric reductase